MKVENEIKQNQRAREKEPYGITKNKERKLKNKKDVILENINKQKIFGKVKRKSWKGKCLHYYGKHSKYKGNKKEIKSIQGHNKRNTLQKQT